MISSSNVHYKSFLSRLWILQFILACWIPVNYARGAGIVDTAQFVVKREGNSSSDCEEYCKKEMLLTCHYFFYLEDSKTCLLSSTDHPAVATQAKTIGIDPLSVQRFMREKKKLILTEIEQVHSLNNQVSLLKSKVQGLQDMKKRMNDLIDKLEVNSSPTGERAMRTLAERVVKLTEVTEMLQSQMSKILDRRSSSSHEIKQLRLKDAKSEAELEQALGNIERLRAYIGTLKRQDDTSHNELEKLMEKYDQLKNRIKWLKKRIDSPQNNPTMIKALHNQKLTSETLKNVEEKVEMFESSQMKSDEMYDRLKGEVIQNEGERRSMLDVLLSLKKEVQSLKTDLKRIENPRSSTNMQRLRTLTSLKGEVELLKRANEDLLKSLRLTRTDLKDLITDIVNLKLDSQSNRAGITAVALAHRHTVQTFNDMNDQQRDLLEKIHTMEDVYRRILEVVHDVEVHQVKLKHEVNQLDNTLHKVSHSVSHLSDEKSAHLAEQTSALGETLSKLSITDLEEEKPNLIKEEKEAKKEKEAEEEEEEEEEEAAVEEAEAKKEKAKKEKEAKKANAQAEIPLKLVNLAGKEDQMIENGPGEKVVHAHKPEGEILTEKRLAEEEAKLNNELKAKNSLKMSDLLVAKQKLKNEQDRLLAEKEIEDQQRLALLAKKKLDEKEKTLEKKLLEDEQKLELKEAMLAEKELPQHDVFKEMMEKEMMEKEKRKKKRAQAEEEEEEEEEEEKVGNKKKVKRLTNEEVKRSEKQLEKKKKLQKALLEEQNTAKKMPAAKNGPGKKVKKTPEEIAKNGKKKNKKRSKRKSRKRKRRRKRKGKKGKKKP